eukprot:357412-Chlamydomonas_euryale.AAC.3
MVRRRVRPRAASIHAGIAGLQHSDCWQARGMQQAAGDKPAPAFMRVLSTLSAVFGLSNGRQESLPRLVLLANPDHGRTRSRQNMNQLPIVDHSIICGLLAAVVVADTVPATDTVSDDDAVTITVIVSVSITDTDTENVTVTGTVTVTVTFAVAVTVFVIVAVAFTINVILTGRIYHQISCHLSSVVAKSTIDLD